MLAAVPEPFPSRRRLQDIVNGITTHSGPPLRAASRCARNSLKVFKAFVRLLRHPTTASAPSNPVLVGCSGDLCPLPLVDARSNLQPALSPIAVETNTRTSRAPPRLHPLPASPKSTPKSRLPPTPKTCKCMVCVCCETNACISPHLLDLPHRYNTHRAYLPDSPAHPLCRPEFVAYLDANANMQLLCEANALRRAMRTLMRSPRYATDFVPTPCIPIRPIAAFAPAPSLFSRPPRRNHSRFRARHLAADVNATARCKPKRARPWAMQTPTRNPCAMWTLPLLSRPPPPMRTPLRSPAAARPRYAASAPPCCACTRASLPAAHRPKASSCERARTVQTNANPPPPLVSYPPPCAGSPCPAVTFAAAPARCKRLRTCPHARHANTRPPNHANECERAPPLRW
ncbi:hypothetical protein B0H13DRAFT_2658090 [Mycena leptocephala]|nr:hypothetical protein B0H13DRAFT_2658090 [Mycena leptocephala]